MTSHGRVSSKPQSIVKSKVKYVFGPSTITKNCNWSLLKTLIFLFLYFLKQWI